MKKTPALKHVKSLLPAGKKWRLIWHDEFDGDTLDRTKWDYRLYLSQQRHRTFSKDGAELDGHGNLLLKLYKKNRHFYSPHLQTGMNFMDRPGLKFGKFTWPIAKLEKPKFAHKYGYYEIRCKLQTQPGWWSAFWLQSPTIGSSLDHARAGVELDIMENFSRDGVCSHNVHWGGYSANHQGAGSGPRKVSPKDFHVFGMDWSRDGYTFYIDGKKSWRLDGPVSDTEQFILVSTECLGYRSGNKPHKDLKKSVLPDYFIVDYVRVFDEVKGKKTK